MAKAAHDPPPRTTAPDSTRPLNQLVTDSWGGADGPPPGLELKTRSLINLAMLTALGKHEELQLHVRGAIRNGVTKSEIQEVLLQTAIYCGVPAALEATRYAQATLDELGVE